MPAPALSEWTPIDGVIKWCVEAATTVVGATYGKVADTYATGLALVRDQQARGQAGPGGASNWAVASQQLTRLGIPNTAYGPGSPSGSLPANWPQILSAAAQTGTPVLVGLPRAFNLQDVQTGAHYDAGVFGHAITVVGQDSLGYLVADPNTPQATKGQYVHYTAANLASAGIDSIVVPNAPPGGGGGSSGGNGGPGLGIGQIAQGIASGLPGFPFGGINSLAGTVLANDPNAVGQAAGTAISQGASGQGWLAGVMQVVESGTFILVGMILIIFGLAFFLFGSRGGVPSRADRGIRAARTAALIAK